MSGASNRLRANGCIYVDPTGRASFSKEKLAGASFQRASGTTTADGAEGLLDEVDNAKSTAKDMGDKSKTKGGLVEALKEDFSETKKFLSESASILSGSDRAAAIEAGADIAPATAASKYDDLKTRGGTYLEKMGGGNKTLGGAKVAAYMVGASMLTDMLNPFDDD